MFPSIILLFFLITSAWSSYSSTHIYWSMIISDFTVVINMLIIGPRTYISFNLFYGSSFFNTFVSSEYDRGLSNMPVRNVAYINEIKPHPLQNPVIIPMNFMLQIMGLTSYSCRPRISLFITPMTYSGDISINSLTLLPAINLGCLVGILVGSYWLELSCNMALPFFA